MKIDTKRLAEDRAYWDEVAPERANWFICPKEDNRNHAFFAVTNTANTGTKCNGETYHVLFEHWHFPIHRPESPAEWNGENVIPPVGCVCEVRDEAGGWHECQIVGRHRGFPVFFCDNWAIDSHYDALPSSAFRPIPTKSERDREDLANTIIANGWEKS